MTRQAEFISVLNSLGAKTATIDGRSFDDMIEAAESAVLDLHGNYVTERAKCMARLGELAKALIADPADVVTRAEIFQIAHDMKGQGSTFGYQLVTDIAGQLCAIIAKHKNAPLEGALVQAIDTHINALGVIIGRDIQGSGGKQGADILAGLKLLAERAVPAA